MACPGPASGLAAYAMLLWALLATSASMAATAEPDAAASAVDAILEIFDRDIITFRAPLMGVSAHDRARRFPANRGRAHLC